MPHFQIDYSGNLDALVDMAAFCETIRATAATLDTFPLAGIRVRALRVDHYAIADGDARHGFVDLSIRLRAGRPQTVKEHATRTIFDAAHAFLAPAMKTHPIALSVEMRDIDPALSPKSGSIRDFMRPAE